MCATRESTAASGDCWLSAVVVGFRGDNVISCELAYLGWRILHYCCPVITATYLKVLSIFLRSSVCILFYVFNVMLNYKTCLLFCPDFNNYSLAQVTALYVFNGVRPDIAKLLICDALSSNRLLNISSAVTITPTHRKWPLWAWRMNTVSNVVVRDVFSSFLLFYSPPLTFPTTIQLPTA